MDNSKWKTVAAEFGWSGNKIRHSELPVKRMAETVVTLRDHIDQMILTLDELKRQNKQARIKAANLLKLVGKLQLG